MKSSHVLRSSRDQARANSTPGAVWAVSRTSPRLVLGQSVGPNFDTVDDVSTLTLDSLSLTFLIHTWQGLALPFPSTLTTMNLSATAAWGGLKPAPARRLRGAYPHLLRTYALPTDLAIRLSRSWRKHSRVIRLVPPLEGCRLPSRHGALPVARWPDLDVGDLPPSLRRHYTRFHTTTGQSAPGRRIGTFSLTGSPLVPFPLASPIRFSSSVRKPESESRLLYTGHRTASK